MIIMNSLPDRINKKIALKETYNVVLSYIYPNLQALGDIKRPFEVYSDVLAI